jgi:hypothetical protein
VITLQLTPQYRPNAALRAFVFFVFTPKAIRGTELL